MSGGSDHRRVKNIIEHMFPIFEQDNSESTTQLIEKFFAGGKLLVSDRLIQIVGEIQNLMNVKS